MAQGAAGRVARLRGRLPRGRPPVAKYIPLHSPAPDARWYTSNPANRAGLAFRALIARRRLAASASPPYRWSTGMSGVLRGAAETHCHRNRVRHNASGTYLSAGKYYNRFRRGFRGLGTPLRVHDASDRGRPLLILYSVAAFWPLQSSLGWGSCPSSST